MISSAEQIELMKFESRDLSKTGWEKRRKERGSELKRDLYRCPEQELKLFALTYRASCSKIRSDAVVDLLAMLCGRVRVNSSLESLADTVHFC